VHPPTANNFAASRMASGNPFGLVTRHFRRRLLSWTTDPDASPAVPECCTWFEGGDYGFQFRYGRSGGTPSREWWKATNARNTRTFNGPRRIACDGVRRIGRLTGRVPWGLPCGRGRDNTPSSGTWPRPQGQLCGGQQAVLAGAGGIHPVWSPVAPDGSLVRERLGLRGPCTTCMQGAVCGTFAGTIQARFYVQEREKQFRGGPQDTRSPRPALWRRTSPVAHTATPGN